MFQSISKTFYQQCEGAILVYDITNKESFDHLSKWLDETNENTDNIPLLLLGNKTDLNDNRKVEETEGAQFAEDNKMLFKETSALKDTDNGIPEAFDELIASLIEKIKLKNDDASSYPTITLSSVNEDNVNIKGDCCS